MATFDSSLGMWKSRQGRYYSTEAEAIAADQVDTTGANSADFFGEGTADQGGAAPPAAPRDPYAAAAWQNANRAAAAPVMTFNRATARGPSSNPEDAARAFSHGNTGGSAGAYNAVSDGGRAQFDYYRDIRRPSSVRGFLNQQGERVGVSHAGDVMNPTRSFDVYASPEAMMLGTYQRTLDPETGLGTTAGGTGGLPLTRTARMVGPSGAAPEGGAGGPWGNAPEFATGEGRANIDEETGDAKDRALDAIETNRDENSQLFADAFGRYDNLGASDYGLSDEARGYQREGLQQQRMLLEKMLGFDEGQYATRYADQALARQIAAGRSAGGGYASQQAGMFAAMEQAPELYAEGARQAANLSNQRLQMAETAAKSFGDLGTMTRGQDEQRAQFESNLGLSIADSVARLTEGNVQMNDRDSQMMAEIWMDFAKLQSVYEGMTSDEQLAWWAQETARRGQDQNFDAIMKQLKAQGAISSKDLIGGLFQLGGGMITAGGTMGAAYITGQAAQNARAAA